MAEFEFVTTFDLSSRGHVPRSNTAIREVELALESLPTPRQGSFASFVCHLSHLEAKLRADSSLVLDGHSKIRKKKHILGRGNTFLVRQASWVKDSNEPPLDVALKEIIPDGVTDSRPTSDWKDILFEIRALLHLPIRYHPNLVRLLGLQWGLSSLSESTYPTLLMEFSVLGSLKHLQESMDPLPFATKQKLCHDVARGLSALHACGIVHGDMKHENVLIYRNHNPQLELLGVVYTAKLADFGGSVMDMGSEDFRRLETSTWPFQAPEWSNPLSRDGMKLTDVYSFGLLIWRAFTDGKGYVSLPGAAQDSSIEDKESLDTQKQKDGLTNFAVADLWKYATDHKVPRESLDITVYAVLATLRLDPADRSLVKAQAALRGTKLVKIEALLDLIRIESNEWEATHSSGPPGKHGLTRDSVRLFSGIGGKSVDLQDNLPGYRPRLSEPSAGEFVFEPYKLKLILSWEQQQQIVEEFKAAAVRITGQALDLKRTVAAFYLFQCHLEEFGVVLNSPEAIEWLRQAAADDESHEDADYQAQAWLWRLSRVLGVELNIPKKQLEDLLRISVFRGHRTGLEDLSQLAFHIRSYDNASWEALYWDAQRLFLKFTGAVGMVYFLPHRMTIKFNLHNLVELDAQLRLHLGENYEKSLKAGAISENRPGNTPQASTDTGEDVNDFDKIYLNERGHGLLHFAAANGNIKALRHLVEKYKCNIDLPNQHVDETPLICACQGGNLDCAIYLLEQGANANGSRFSHEGPLHWMCSFPLPEIEVLVPTLIAEGADIELYGGGMRHDVRGIRADWEHNFDITVTPLGRAVLMRNVDAVEVLLELGADPLAKTSNRHQGQMTGLHMQKELSVSCPFELAAVLTLPRILEKMLAHIDRSNREKQMRVIDEVAVLNLAHNKRVTKFNPLTLQSRLVRCGVTYVTDLRTTLFTLSRRAQKWHEARDNEEINKERSEVLCKEISLGNVDIVQCLLDLNYPVDGCKEFKPIEQAISLNHENIFQLLLKHKVDLTSIRTTPDGSQLSLLHLCASRPKQSRPGRTIVDHLISDGLPLDTKDGKRSSLVLAILNQNFDVATALLENQADVNAPYQIESPGLDEHFRESEVRTVTILAELLVQHTAGSLESLRFLFGKNPRGSLHRPDFIVDKTRNLSAFHILAESQQFTETAQITPQILNLCGQAYSEPSFINYVHPILGSPLYYAASVGNLAVASLLLSKGADVSNLAGPDLTLSVRSLLRTEESWTALWAAILRYDEEIQNLVVFPPSDPLDLNLDSRLLANLESIIERLFERDNDQLARDAWKRLAQRKRGLTKKHNDAVSARIKKRSEYQATKDDMPVELWMLEDSDGEVNKVDKKVAELSGKEWVTDELRKYFPTGL